MKHIVVYFSIDYSYLKFIYLFICITEQVENK